MPMPISCETPREDTTVCAVVSDARPSAHHAVIGKYYFDCVSNAVYMLWLFGCVNVGTRVDFYSYRDGKVYIND